MENQQPSKELKQHVFDLTTKQGVMKALVSLNPYVLVFKVFERILSSHEERIKRQGKMVEDLIQHGKEKGLDEATIKVNNTKGFKLNVPLDEKLQVGTELASDDSMIIHVKYK